MNRVEDLAMKYCEGSSFVDACVEKPAYIAGYRQAEKDLGLTWNDIATIEKLCDDFVKHNQTPMSDEEYFKEILKRFNNEKSK